MAWETLFGGPVTFNMLYAGNVVLRVEGQHGYNTALPAPWSLLITLDGQPVRSSGGAGAVTENPYCGVPIFNLAAGSHTVVFQWYGKDSNMSFSNASAYIDRRYI